MGPQSGGRKGKVLFIVIDQLRADCLTGALGQVLELPNIRALMAEGVTLAQHFTVTNPCGPARASLLTGLYAMNHRSVRNGTPLARHHTNLALEARKAGYEPLLFGYTDTWQLVINTGTTIVTFLMVFVIQNTQNRDTAAMHIKIDELIRVTGKARNILLDLEELDDKTLENLRLDYEGLARKAKSRAKAPETIKAVPKRPARSRAKGQS